MHFKIEGGEMYIYNIYIYVYTKSAEWCYDDIIYIYVCASVMKRVKITKIYVLRIRIFTPYI